MLELPFNKAADLPRHQALQRCRREGDSGAEES